MYEYLPTYCLLIRSRSYSTYTVMSDLHHGNSVNRDEIKLKYITSTVIDLCMN